MNSRDWKIGSVGTSLLAAAMLLCALLGKPPHAFFSLLRLVVAAAFALAAWMLHVQSRRFLPLTLVFAIMAYVFLFWKMHRADWAFFDWSATACLLLSTFVVGISVQRSP